MDKLIIEGQLSTSKSNYLVIVNDKGEAIEIDATLLRSVFLNTGEQIRLTFERAE